MKLSCSRMVLMTHKAPRPSGPSPGKACKCRLHWLSASSNAALEWQAGHLRWRSRELAVASPLKGLVRRCHITKGSLAALDLCSRDQDTSASLLSMALKMSPRAEPTLKIGTKSDSAIRSDLISASQYSSQKKYPSIRSILCIQDRC